MTDYEYWINWNESVNFNELKRKWIQDLIKYIQEKARASGTGTPMNTLIEYSITTMVISLRTPIISSKKTWPSSLSWALPSTVSQYLGRGSCLLDLASTYINFILKSKRTWKYASVFAPLLHIFNQGCYRLSLEPLKYCESGLLFLLYTCR